mmetsp:Transcript_4983/g.10477  ORF Transcript_4983/g.10477 Transcript_4983/m.10477 type:complete len:122 (-) Transcript_4983:902-1267(-)
MVLLELFTENAGTMNRISWSWMNAIQNAVVHPLESTSQRNLLHHCSSEKKIRKYVHVYFTPLFTSLYVFKSAFTSSETRLHSRLHVTPSFLVLLEQNRCRNDCQHANLGLATADLDLGFTE